MVYAIGNDASWAYADAGALGIEIASVDRFVARQAQLPPPPPPPPMDVEDNDRFNDVDGDESGIHGFDISTDDRSDAFFGYAGRDEEGAWRFGAGLIDFENSKPDHWLNGFEILTVEGRGNVVGEFGPDDFVGVGFDANVIQANHNIGGHTVDWALGSANGNLGGNPDGYGAMFNANAAEIAYENGAPSADNANDLSVRGGLSLGFGGGLNIVYNDPDNDGRTNLGFDVAVPFVSGGLSSETAGVWVEEQAEEGGEWLMEKAYEIDNAWNDVTEIFSGRPFWG